MALSDRSDELAVAIDRLRDELRQLERVVVAFSGGADSSFLAHVAREVLGRDRCQVVPAISPSLASNEREECEALAAEWDLD